MTFWSLMFLDASFFVFMFMCTRLMACIRSKLKNYPLDEWKGYLLSMLVSLVLLVGCLIAADITSVHCPTCNELAVNHYCEQCDVYAVTAEATCPDCQSPLSYGFCESCGTLKNSKIEKGK
jgi:hypothetical protein